MGSQKWIQYLTLHYINTLTLVNSSLYTWNYKLIEQILANPYFISIAIPTILLITGAFAKKLVRGSNWHRSDFYLGVEFSLAALSAGLIYLFDIANNHTNLAPMEPKKIIIATAYLAVTFFLLLWILSTHQDWEKKEKNPKGQIFRLCILSNLLGCGLLVSFVIVVKGVK